MSEPFRLKAWKLVRPFQGLFYTCARPGRSLGTKAKVPDHIVLDWARGLPGGQETFVISLLGEKPTTGRSEFSFYSSFSEAESFAAFLNGSILDRQFYIIDYPTIDRKEIAPAMLATIADRVRRLISQQRTVVIMDSGGCTRTGAVAKYLGASPIPASLLLGSTPTSSGTGLIQRNYARLFARCSGYHAAELRDVRPTTSVSKKICVRSGGNYWLAGKLVYWFVPWMLLHHAILNLLDKQFADFLAL